MATPAHCLFCFESLSASFNGTEPPRLGKVEELWDEYQKENASEEEETEDLQDLDDEDEDLLGQETTDTNKTTAPLTLQPPSISRLQASASPLSSSSSNSAASSASALTNPSTTSTNTTPSTYSTALKTAPSEQSYPLFVTWNTTSSRSSTPQLRGCIGTFEALPLPRGLETYALTSAFDDVRFNPIPSSLLPKLSCAITLLADFTTCKHPLDWDLGIHGIRISFLSKGGHRRYGSTYLPDVAVEQGWSKEETVESLMRKSGWDGTTAATYSSGGVGVARRLLRGGRGSSGITQTEETATESGKKYPWEEVQDFKTIRYTGLRSDATYAEWREWRDWVEAKGLDKTLK